MTFRKLYASSPKKVKIVLADDNYEVNPTFNLHKDETLHKSIPCLPTIRKYQSSSNARNQINNASNDYICLVFYNFLEKIVQDQKFMCQLQKSLHFTTESNLYVKSFKKVKVDKQSTSFLPSEQLKNQRRISKKISIFMDSCQNSSENSSESFLSSQILKMDNPITLINQLQLPNIALNFQLFQKIFPIPSLFLINLAICLLFKYSFLSKVRLNNSNVGWLLCISSIISFKIYYDEPLQDLMEMFSESMKIGIKDLITLQRIYLEGLDYRAIISGNQYQYVVGRVFELDKQNHIHA